MGEHEKTDVTEADGQQTNGAESNADPGQDEAGAVSGEAEEESGTQQPGADPEDADQIEKERQERLDPDNRPDGAEVDNSDREFDAEKGLYTDSDGYEEAEERFPPMGEQGASATSTCSGASTPRNVETRSVVRMRGIVRDVAVLLLATVMGIGVVLAMSADAARSATPSQCTNDDVTASYRGGDAATSHVYGRIVLTNTSDAACWVQGYGGLSYVGHGDGTQIGAAADRTASKKPKTVLQPGDKVRSRVVETSTGPYSAKECKPRKVDGFRVYIPDETHSQFIEHETTGCANTAIHLLTHKAYR